LPPSPLMLTIDSTFPSPSKFFSRREEICLKDYEKFFSYLSSFIVRLNPAQSVYFVSPGPDFRALASFFSKSPFMVK
ncbi:MAG: hypothetical protein ACTSQS_14530, partial [Promethearchaeota archaeon]